MHSFAVNIRICQPENSDVHQGELYNDVHSHSYLWQNLDVLKAKNIFQCNLIILVTYDK